MKRNLIVSVILLVIGCVIAGWFTGMMYSFWFGVLTAVCFAFYFGGMLRLSYLAGFEAHARDRAEGRAIRTPPEGKA